uniref:hypothetical protein n=1 Tax=Gracilaria flabelliformis subsp. simplex TaxID=1638138 RepID=UPI001D108D61|nr:hypothetical protein LK244_pgp130 [Gracilaria flabelliformis subsp. simplex]UAD85979.1 hypothetical protein [Gracilaria flabelliformis subsp. simplex]
MMLINSRVKGETTMESMQYINNLNDDLNVDDLSLETPIGWSSTCFDETIHYYIDCNSNCIGIKHQNETDNN